jgi:Arc/MetJ family transcription regulator
MHEKGILICMRTTLNIDDSLVKKASKLSGIAEKTALVKAGLEALIARESSRRLAELAGSEKSLRPIRRRKSR